MSNESQASKTESSAAQIQSAAQSEAEWIEKAVADIAGMCGHVFCEGLFMRIKPEIMALACERHPKVLEWWRSMVRMGHPTAGIVWAEIQARMDVRAAERAIDEAMASTCRVLGPRSAASEI